MKEKMAGKEFLNQFLVMKNDWEKDVCINFLVLIIVIVQRPRCRAVRYDCGDKKDDECAHDES